MKLSKQITARVHHSPAKTHQTSCATQTPASLQTLTISNKVPQDHNAVVPGYTVPKCRHKYMQQGRMHLMDMGSGIADTSLQLDNAAHVACMDTGSARYISSNAHDVLHHARTLVG